MDPVRRKQFVEPLVSEKRPIADQFPAFASAMAGRDGRIWIREYPRPRLTAPPRWIAFDAEGRFSCTVTVPAVTQLLEFGADYLLTRDRDSVGVERGLQCSTAALTGRYEVEREIGAGGMATVYLARDVRHDRRVALKVLRPELGAVLGVERFLAEIKVTANLQHPNLLPLFDSGEAEGVLFYVMPYVEGESLRARLQREKQLPVDEAVRIATAIAIALEVAMRM